MLDEGIRLKDSNQYIDALKKLDETQIVIKEHFGETDMLPEVYH